MSEKDGAGEDRHSVQALDRLSERARLFPQRFNGIKTVLVVLSSRAMVFDPESLRQKIVLVYPEAAVFFKTTSGQAMGVSAPRKVDLVIDLTGPDERQPFMMPRKLRRVGRIAVGRKVGWFGIRKRSYDRVFDEFKSGSESQSVSLFDRERHIQAQVLSLAGIAFVPAGDPTADREKTIALELPNAVP